MFKFSIRQLLIVTTVFAVLTAIAIRLNLISVSDWQVIGLLGAAYLLISYLSGPFSALVTIGNLSNSRRTASNRKSLVQS